MLSRRGFKVLDEISRKLKEVGAVGKPLVLCGHSLGGGYAQAAACYLLELGWDIAAVRTFGSLHPLAPLAEVQPGNLSTAMLQTKLRKQRDKSRKTLQKLGPVVQHYMFAWDPVPRLPLCQELSTPWPGADLQLVSAIRLRGEVCAATSLVVMLFRMG